MINNIILKLQKHQYSTIQNKNYGITFQPYEINEIVNREIIMHKGKPYYTSQNENIPLTLLSRFKSIQVISKGQLLTVIIITNNLVLIELPKSQYIALNL